MSRLGEAIKTVLSLMPQETLLEDAKTNRFTMIKNGMGFASRDYAGERNWLIIDNQSGRSMVLTGAIYHQFNLEMSVFGWDTNGEPMSAGKKMAFKGTPEEALIAHSNVILKFFEMCEEEDNVMRRLQGKPTHQEERTRKKALQDRKQVIENRINNLDAEHERLFRKKEDELLITTSDWRKTYHLLTEVEKELNALEGEMFRIEGSLAFDFGD